MVDTKTDIHTTGTDCIEGGVTDYALWVSEKALDVG